MNRPLPRIVMATLLVTMLTSLACGLYAEAHFRSYLDDHPYSVNLLSGITGFSATALVLAIAVEWAVHRDHARQLRRSGATQLFLLSTFCCDLAFWASTHDEDYLATRPRREYEGFERLRRVATNLAAGDLLSADKQRDNNHRVEQLSRNLDIVKRLVAEVVDLFELKHLPAVKVRSAREDPDFKPIYNDVVVAVFGLRSEVVALNTRIQTILDQPLVRQFMKTRTSHHFASPVEQIHI